jgi:hypothetical protein
MERIINWTIWGVQEAADGFSNFSDGRAGWWRVQRQWVPAASAKKGRGDWPFAVGATKNAGLAAGVVDK